MDLEIKGKKAIMAGGSAGMGRATAERLAEAGVDLVITARREERLVTAAKEISEQYGTTVTPVVADSSKEEGRQALFAACPDPDILAITIKPPAPNGDFLKVTPDMWRESIETALIGPIEIMRHYIPVMREKGWGRIVKYRHVFGEEPDDLAPHVRTGTLSLDQLHSERFSRGCQAWGKHQQPAARYVPNRRGQRTFAGLCRCFRSRT